MRNKRALKKDYEREINMPLRRFIFAISTLPAIFNLLMYSLLISGIRTLLLCISGGAAIYFALGFFFEIKDGEWSDITIGCNTLVCLLISILFPLAYKIYLWFIVIAIELALALFAYFYREKFGVPK